MDQLLIRVGIDVLRDALHQLIFVVGLKAETLHDDATGDHMDVAINEARQHHLAA